jgi:hypothetical protein
MGVGNRCHVRSGTSSRMTTPNCFVTEFRGIGRSALCPLGNVIPPERRL